MNSELVSDIFLSICRLAFVPPSQGKIAVECHETEEMVFHKMHMKFRKEAKGKDKYLLDERYPFVKVGRKWYLSIPKLYMYLFGARKIIAKSKHETMITLFSAIQNASRYYDEYKKIDQSLTPSGHLNYEDYQKKQAQLYRDYCAEQLTLFSDPHR